MCFEIFKLCFSTRKFFKVSQNNKRKNVRPRKRRLMQCKFSNLYWFKEFLTLSSSLISRFNYPCLSWAMFTNWEWRTASKRYGEVIYRLTLRIKLGRCTYEKCCTVENAYPPSTNRFISKLTLITSQRQANHLLQHVTRELGSVPLSHQ